jgi:chorismate mutase
VNLRSFASATVPARVAGLAGLVAGRATLLAGLGALLAGRAALLAGSAALLAGCAQGGAQPDAGPELARVVGLAADRLATADAVAAAKWTTGGAISDPARETVVLDAATAGATARGLDARDTTTVFRDQIEASKAVQYGLFSDWSADPGHAPASAPDLGGVRPVLDRITPELLDGLRAAAAPRTGPGCPADLRRAVERTARDRGLDALHREGLDRAVRSLCH